MQPKRTCTGGAPPRRKVSAASTPSAEEASA
uniref:Uncharacterized protein n=1 Tax=Arundo donax TaxID=35708 RepID=A0A0A9HQA3_ARUDO